MKAYRSRRIEVVQILRNWLHQGVSYMDRGERVVRLSLEGAFVVLSSLMLVALGVSGVASVFLTIAVVHTVFWVFNGNFWALVQFSIPLNTAGTEGATLSYLAELQRRAEAQPAIEGVALFGSPTRGAWHGFSDLDMRFVRAEGFVNLLTAGLFMMRERAIAALQRKPLDSFLADGPTFLDKMRKDERPIFLVKRGDRMELAFPDNGPVCLIRLAADVGKQDLSADSRQ